tara:strand:- start:11717 stop:13444 length:1728 start_codon:yes stop_codon:yes gene_type:complete
MGGAPARRRRVFTAIVTVLTILGAWLWLVLPNPSREIQMSMGEMAPNFPVTVAGAFHVHTNRSDGGSSPNEIARAANEAGLQFVVFTDHGNGTRVPDPPQYRSGVLTFDAVEISTNGGHYIAVELPATPYPLGGEAYSVVEDVRRFGGFGVIAHPGSPRESLAWIDPSLPVDGMEWLNADSEWRDESTFRLLGAGLSYFFRRSETLATLLDRPTQSLQIWDEASQKRQIVGLAGHDAHGPVTVGVAEEGSVSLGLGFPGYKELFETFSLNLQLADELVGQADVDARLVLNALRAGRVFTVVDAVASGASFDFVALGKNQRYSMGETVPLNDVEELLVSVSPTPGSEIVLIQNGRAIHRTEDSSLRYRISEPAVYRVEVLVKDSGADGAVPWIVGNTVRIGFSDNFLNSQPPFPAEVMELMPDFRAEEEIWTAEADEDSIADVIADSNELVFRYQLSGLEDANSYAAAVRSLDGVDPQGLNAVSLIASADRPVRVSVQLRDGRGAEDVRWRASFYADQEPHSVTIPFSRFTSTIPMETETLRIEEMDTFLIVADLVNASPGTDGELRLEDVQLERR